MSNQVPLFKAAKVVVAVAMIVSAVVVSGCGGSADSTDTTAGPSKAAFIKAADAKCDAGNQEQSEAVRIYARQHSGASEATVIKAVIFPHIRETVERLGKMDAPSGDEEQIQAIVESVTKATEEAEENLARLAKPSTNPFEDGARLAQEYGLKICGQYA